MQQIKKIILAIMLIMGLFALSSCNTIAGAGKDLEAAGDSIEDSANKNKNY